MTDMNAQMSLLHKINNLCSRNSICFIISLKGCTSFFWLLIFYLQFFLLCVSYVLQHFRNIVLVSLF